MKHLPAFLIATAFVSTAASAPDSLYVRQFPSSGDLHLELRDRIDHPLYWWPRTLLSYAVRFEGAHVKASELVLRSEPDGQAVPFQLSDVQTSGLYLAFARVCFFSDLPAGGRRNFVFSQGHPETFAPGVHVTHEPSGSTVLDTGLLKVRIPGSAALFSSGEVPGPILQVSRGSKWIGSSSIVSRDPVTSLETVQQEIGPLFVRHRLTYRFRGGGRYSVLVQATAGYDFISVKEEMTAISNDAGAFVRMSWDNFHPTHRQAPNHPYGRPGKQPGYGRYEWETIDQGNVSTQHGVSAGIDAAGELPFRLGPYQPWGAYVILTSANFWDQQAGDALGIFIDRGEQWDDHEYAIWSSSNTLQVRYYWQDGTLFWTWPLANGSRSTGVALYDHTNDIREMEQLDRLSRPFPYKDGQTYRATLSPTSHTMFLQNRYGTIDLDLVKDWDLSYPANRRQPPVIFHEGTLRTPSELLQRAATNELFRDLPTQGTRQTAGFSPVPSRGIYGWHIDGFDRLRADMTEAQRERLTAMYLMLAYTHADEDYMPMQTMLSGHPNFLSDVKSAPATLAFLFPEHPMAHEWADEFGKFLELNTRYHTRPAVSAWGADGGRWTENLGTYVWAFLRPALRANYVLQKYGDGKNRLAIPQIAEIGDWLVNSLSAPFNGEDPNFYKSADGSLPRHYWGLVTPEKAPRRLHPPQGAHSSRRMPPRSMWLLGKLLIDYDPLTAEHMMWAARPNDEDAEEPPTDPWSIMWDGPDNRGTNPHLKSSKYTGYGITLRSGEDTPGEVSVHLQQIDEGPNYRWGIAGEGGNGVIYYYAGGKSYSHNAREDVGDRAAHDTDFCSNFGVWKNGSFRSIGRNVLDRPLRDVEVAQFAEITPRKGTNSYAWPEYQSRSVLMAGADYFVVYDDVFNDAVAHRFSWFTHARDDMPLIHMVRGGIREREKLVTQVSTGATKGVWYDGLGDAMAVISHDKSLKVENAAFGAVVSGSGFRDLVFREPEGVTYDDKTGTAFEGKAGWIRDRTDGSAHVAILQGTKLAHRGLTLVIDRDDSAVSAIVPQTAQDGVRGVIVSGMEGTVLNVRALLQGAAFYLDGVRQAVDCGSGSCTVRLPSGRHVWELSRELPVPPPPVVLHTANHSGGARLDLGVSGGATEYRVEISNDNGKSWRMLTKGASPHFDLTGLRNGIKIHVRGIAANAQHASSPGPEYPIYVSGDPPNSPDGLHVQLETGKATLTWGEVLGVSEYRLYRRRQGETTFQRVYGGPKRRFDDTAPAIVPAFAKPGARANATRNRSLYVVYEYAVSAVNGNGESRTAPAIDTDPTSWANWDPKPGEPFRRRFTYNTTNYLNLGKESSVDRYYPK